jgi:hypothetical protein
MIEDMAVDEPSAPLKLIDANKNDRIDELCVNQTKK